VGYRFGALSAFKLAPAVLAAVLIVSLAAGLVAGCGSEPFEVSGGSLGIDSTQDGEPVIEGNTVTITGTNHAQMIGDLEGTNESYITMVIDTATGSFTIEYDVTFTGSLGDKQGTLTSHGEGTGQMLSPDSSTWTVSETILSGTGDFKGLTGTTQVEGQGSSEGDSASFVGTWQYE